MSGPKGGSYHVETAAQREARMLRAALADYARAEQEWATAQVRLAAAASLTGDVLACGRPTPLRDNADSAACARAAQELRDAAAAAVEVAGESRRRASAALHADQVARLMVRIDDAEPVRTVVRKSRWQASPATAPRTADIDRDRVAERVRARLDGFAAVDHDTAKVAALVRDIAGAGSQSRVDLLIAELDHLLAETRAGVEREERSRQVCGDLHAMQARISGLTSPAASDLRTRLVELIAVAAQEIPADLAAEVDRLIADADAESDRLCVVEAMASALTELGYGTGPEFSTALSSTQATAYARSGASQYGIKVRLESDTNRFTAQVVKSDATLTSTAEDEQAERDFCGTVNRLIEAVAGHGVVLDLDIRTPPGACAVQSVAAVTLGNAASTQRRGARRQQEQRAP